MGKFEEGIVFAAAMLNRLYDQPTMAAEIITESGLENYNCSGFDEFDKQELRLIRDTGIQLKGL